VIPTTEIGEVPKHPNVPFSSGISYRNFQSFNVHGVIKTTWDLFGGYFYPFCQQVANPFPFSDPFKQTGNTLDLTINGTTASLAPQTLFGCGSPSTQCVLDGMIWNGNTLNNQYLGIALVDLSDFGVAAGAALAGDMQLHLVEGGSKPVVLNLAGAFYTSAPTTVVPVPAAVWLFGSGLLGLAGLARRR